MKMSRMFTVLALPVAAALATAAFADPVQLGSYGTGDPSMGNANTPLVYEGYSTSATASPTGTAASYEVNPGTTWEAALPNSAWVSNNPGAGPAVPGVPGSGTVVDPNGYYYYGTTFMATAGETISGTIDVLADDTAEVLLNGVVIVPFGSLGTDGHCATGVPNCSSTDVVSFDATLLGGKNTITIIDEQSALDAAGVDFSGSISPTPEPGSLFLLGTGLIGLAGAVGTKYMRAS